MEIGLEEQPSQFENPTEPHLTNSVLLLVTTRITPTYEGPTMEQMTLYGEKLTLMNKAGLHWWYPTVPFGPGGWEQIIYWHKNEVPINDNSLSNKGEPIENGPDDPPQVKWEVSFDPMDPEGNNKTVKEFRIFDLLIYVDKNSWDNTKSRFRIICRGSRGR